MGGATFAPLPLSVVLGALPLRVLNDGFEESEKAFCSPINFPSYIIFIF